MLSTTLAGATFQLFYLENGNRVPVKDSDGQNVTFTTGADGSVLIVGHLQNLGWTLWADRTYCLIETVAPFGYELSNEPIYFILTEHPSSQIEFDITGDQLNVKNDPMKVSVQLFATKTVDGEEPGDLRFEFELYTSAGEVLQTKENDSSGRIAFDPLYFGVDDIGYVNIYIREKENPDSLFTQDSNYYFAAIHISLSDTGSLVAEVRYLGFSHGDPHVIAPEDVIFNNTSRKVSIPVEKTWIGPGTDSVTVELLANGVKVAEAVLNEANGWQHTFTDLDQYNNGVEIIYVVRELRIDGYSTEIVGNVNDGFVIKNINTETIEIPVVKQWVGPATDSVTINLLADGEAVEEVVLNAENDWHYTFTDLLKYDSTDGHEITYTIEELDLTGYNSAVTGNVNDGFVITNTNTETIDIPVIKQWVGPAAESVTIQLFANGEVIDEVVLNEENGWQHTFTDLPRYDSTDGSEIVYDVQEVPVNGYAQGRTGTIETGFTFTNTITGKVSIPVTKVWIGLAAESVTVELLADNVKVAESLCLLETFTVLTVGTA